MRFIPTYLASRQSLNKRGIEMAKKHAILTLAENEIGAAPVKAVPVWLLPIIGMLGPFAVRPILGALAKASSVESVKAEAKKWIANNGG